MLGRLGGLVGDFWEYRLGLRVGGGQGFAITSRVKGQLGRRGGREDWLLQNTCLLLLLKELSLLQVGLNILVKWLLELLLRLWPELLNVLLELLWVMLELL